MRIHDISLVIEPSLPTWPGDPGVVVTRTSDMQAGDVANVSHLSLSAHSGTHVDAPRHFIHGAESVEQLPLDTLIGPARVAFLREAERVDVGELETLDLPPGVERLLLRTRNSDIWTRKYSGFTTAFVALTPEAAEWLVTRGIRLIGVDYLSVQRYSDPEPITHRVLLTAGVVIVEGLNLSEVLPGEYHLICLPLRIKGSDGAPARVVLLED